VTSGVITDATPLMSLHTTHGDTIFAPGASLTFPNLFANQTGLRFDYKYLLDHSNDPTKSFTDHIVTASIIARFDPTQPPPWMAPTRP